MAEMDVVPPQEVPQGFIPSNDGEYFRWLHGHQHGFVLNLKGRREITLHRATCTHIDRHNNAGAMTERATRKICFERGAEVRAWLRANGYGPVPAKCGDCDP